MKKTLTVLFAGLLTVMASTTTIAHCQIPCGIYDDNLRVKLMLEDATTVIKATDEIAKLAGKTDAQSSNQMVRWVMNKEQHAQNVIESISDYFLTQRVKTKQKDYAERLQKHHAVIVAAMKAKQNADDKYALALHKAIKAIEGYYPAHKH
ncbi:superoxide dismutase [Pseudomaricurvus alkylphenolicus]|jgi:nickel superoxide dismutase|uniref:superoxide dismutase [Ni] n=1 Tax=Pseudomaricurvus alkylphenolicus TaxID=1306991 RepID=UPI00141F18AF|nr:superoxide dismutase [Ni] [Pseudomaricurvus alkylphenolicus]NIB43655.1 superoxide dismutase [Pseudomaricurvus alkylphenolicus]